MRVCVCTKILDVMCTCTREINWYICKSSNTTLSLAVCITTLGHNYIFRPSNLAIFKLYMRNLSIGYTNVSGGFVGSGGGRLVRDFVYCQGCMVYPSNPAAKLTRTLQHIAPPPPDTISVSRLRTIEDTHSPQVRNTTWSMMTS